MRKDDAQLTQILLAQLTASEKARGVAYVCQMQVARGAALILPRAALSVPWQAQLAFIDREPLSAWGHSCRYLLINVEHGFTLSHEARFPPFRRGHAADWQVIRCPDGLPDRALLVERT